MPYNPINFLSSSSVLAESWEATKTLKKSSDFADSPSMEKKQNPGLRKACRQLESLFLSQLLQEMRKTVPQGGAIPENNGASLYQSLFDNHLADLMAKQQAAGLGNFFYRELLDTEGKIS
ncbi:MAG: rod-binding protein [Pseudomonadota bacterium]|nr:rod-binding protein [Pseudomonadota bacterium]